MRKRLVIGAIAAMVMGVGAYVLSQPRKGTVEWHKRGYLRSDAILKNPDSSNIARRVIDEFTQPSISEREVQRFEHHQQALIDLGFLERREYGPYSPPLGAYDEQLRRGLAQIRQTKPEFTEVFCERRDQTNFVVVVIGLPADMPKWERLIPRLDLAESK